MEPESKSPLKQDDSKLISLGVSQTDAAPIRNKPYIPPDPSRKYPRNESPAFSYISRGTTLLIDLKQPGPSSNNSYAKSDANFQGVDEPDFIIF
ncbi:unnamed protein product [Allacma fusca]|uniref:Uncharacterized protein n=1 Tax=Allacma fusca TaxID=39272 RepID=A0A8J2L0A7_9HEXA|nr:unnamed protein product [Allacma fusca]